MFHSMMNNTRSAYLGLQISLILSRGVTSTTQMQSQTNCVESNNKNVEVFRSQLKMPVTRSQSSTAPTIGSTNAASAVHLAQSLRPGCHGCRRHGRLAELILQEVGVGAAQHKDGSLSQIPRQKLGHEEGARAGAARARCKPLAWKHNPWEVGGLMLHVPATFQNSNSTSQTQRSTPRREPSVEHVLNHTPQCTAQYAILSVHP